MRSRLTDASNGGAQPVDRDALLRALFPAGIPPRQDVIKQSTPGSTKQNASPAPANRSCGAVSTGLQSLGIGAGSSSEAQSPRAWTEKGPVAGPFSVPRFR